MNQIITGPFGRVAYHGISTTGSRPFPALNLPCCAFARGDRLVAANYDGPVKVSRLPRRKDSGGGVALFGPLKKREG